MPQTASDNMHHIRVIWLLGFHGILITDVFQLKHKRHGGFQSRDIIFLFTSVCQELKFI